MIQATGKSFILLTLVGLLFSCTSYKRNLGTTITEKDGYRLISNKEKGIYIYYYGDYWFHDLQKKHTLNWNDNFIRSIGWDKHQKEILFVGNTIVEPYCSSLAMLYRKCKSAEIAKGVAEHVKRELHAQNVLITEEMIAMFRYTVLTYDLRDEQLRVSARYREYYSDEGEDVLRVVFWSMESCRDWTQVVNESKMILETRVIVAP